MPLENGEPTAAEVLALANRLLAQKAAPGWHDLKLIGEMLKNEANAVEKAYRGRDGAELLELHLRAQIAELYVAEFFGRVEAAIENARGLPGFQQDDPRPPLITARVAGSY